MSTIKTTTKDISVFSKMTGEKDLLIKKATVYSDKLAVHPSVGFYGYALTHLQSGMTVMEVMAIYFPYKSTMPRILGSLAKQILDSGLDLDFDRPGAMTEKTSKALQKLVKECIDW